MCQESFRFTGGTLFFVAQEGCEKGAAQGQMRRFMNVLTYADRVL